MGNGRSFQRCYTACCVLTLNLERCRRGGGGAWGVKCEGCTSVFFYWRPLTDGRRILIAAHRATFKSKSPGVHADVLWPINNMVDRPRQKCSVDRKFLRSVPFSPIRFGFGPARLGCLELLAACLGLCLNSPAGCRCQQCVPWRGEDVLGRIVLSLGITVNAWIQGFPAEY